MGWKTSYQSKKALISHFQDLLRQRTIKIYDESTIEEMKTFIWNNEARQQGAGAQRGFRDDDVMSTMLAFWNIEVRPKQSDDVLSLGNYEEYKPRRKKQFQYL